VTLFVDASALIAVIAGEDDGLSLMERMMTADELLWSPITEWESVAGLRHGHQVDIDDARVRVSAFALDNRFRLVPLGPPEGAAALEAYQVYGKGRHPAALNMSDCFAYACAKTNGAGLLYKGSDFSQTDLA
jgi:ribonuclease VapC